MIKINCKQDSCVSTDTTINIDKAMLEKVEKLAKQKRTKRNLIINYCVSKFAQYNKKTSAFFSMCKFQAQGKHYSRIHLTLSMLEYEVSHDLKKSLKLSFSLIVFLALSEFLDDFDKKNERSEPSSVAMLDKYRLKSYKIKIFETQSTRNYTYEWQKE